MQVINSSVAVLNPERSEGVLKRLELVARNCYKSEERIGEGSAEKLIKNTIMKRKHYSILEHEGLQVRFICNRGVMAELTRHRLASFAVESTRYCNYSGNLTFIDPQFGAIPGLPLPLLQEMNDEWEKAMLSSEASYNTLIELGVSPQYARGVLPIDVKTEVVATMNLRQWRWVFSQRLSKAAHPHIRKLFKELLTQFKELVPVIFDDIS